MTTFILKPNFMFSLYNRPTTHSVFNLLNFLTFILLRVGVAGAKYYSFCAYDSDQKIYATLSQKIGIVVYTGNKNFRPAVMLTRRLIQWVSGSVFSGVKQLESGANHLPSCSADRGTTALYQCHLLFSLLHIYFSIKLRW